MPWYSAEIELVTRLTVEFEAAITEAPAEVALQVARDSCFSDEVDDARIVQIYRVR